MENPKVTDEDYMKLVINPLIYRLYKDIIVSL